ncbi:hypothetical protein K449DRAFT_388365 [Hypoxylon sp. EC38]|nr:hypothetical protein K449DRAFT_388365 [Hypoxylon sp. EC38]
MNTRTDVFHNGDKANLNLSSRKTRNRKSYVGVSKRQSQRNDATPTSPTRTFACPFYKIAPRQHQRCARSVLSKICYVKQHLIRNHSAGIYCPRCYEKFSQISDLESHQRQNKVCKKRPEKEISGITATHKEWLSRRTKPTLTEDEKWCEIFTFLFGECPKSICPYIDLDLPEEVNWLRDYIVSEVPERLKQMNPTDDVADLLSCVVEDWKRCWREGNTPQMNGCPDPQLKSLGS